jgi:Holliday junction resolvase-like predicted endonuclease
LLFQVGYLTIDKKFIKDDRICYSLKIPNFEVETAFVDNLTEIYLNDIEQDIIDSQVTLWESIKNADSETLANYLEIQYNESPYQLNINNKRERWKVKQVIFSNILNVLGFKAKGEVSISQGRMDAIFRNKNYVVVTEVKYTQDQKKSLDELVNTALNQIHEKRYYHIYEKKNYHVILLALAFKDIKINKKDILTEVKCKIELLKS